MTGRSPNYFSAEFVAAKPGDCASSCCAPRSSSDVRLGLRCGHGQVRWDRPAGGDSACEPVPGLPGQPWPVVPLPPSVPRSAAPGACALRAGCASGCTGVPARRHRAQGDVDEAIGHATAASDFAVACDLIARHWLPLFNLGRARRWHAGSTHCRANPLRADARVCLARAWATLQPDVVEEMESWLRARGARRAAGILPRHERHHIGGGQCRPAPADQRPDGRRCRGSRLSGAVPSCCIRTRLTRAGRSTKHEPEPDVLLAGDLTGAEAALRNGLDQLPAPGGHSFTPVAWAAHAGRSRSG